MEIINNENHNENHEQKLLRCFREADDILIVSPFLSKNFSFFPFEELTHLKEITLITTFKDSNDDLKGKISFFKKLKSFGEKRQVKVSILIDNSLHGKIYICKRSNIYTSAIITSANFTQKGLKKNNEWGISISNSDDIEDIVSTLYKNIIYKPITEQDIHFFDEHIAPNIKDRTESSSNIDLSDFYKVKEIPVNILTGANYWLKPVGVIANPIPLDKQYNSLTEKLHFARPPRKVKLGDILIVYAVGHKNVVSIYRVKSESYKVLKTKERWPYYVEGENLTPYYGEQWQKYNITISELLKDVDGKFNATPSGKNSYGSLMRGADKLQITPEYANYIIRKIVKINDDILTKIE